MIKKDGIKTQTKANLQEAFKCGDCLHFKQSPHRSNSRVCAEEGVRSFAIAPRCFTPDYTKVITNTDEFMSIVSFFNSRTPQQRKILMGMLRQQPSGKKLRMGTKMYLNLRNREYVSNYVCGYVVGYTSGGELVLSGSPDSKTRGRSFFAYLRSDSSLLSAKEWKAKYSELLSKGRLQDPTSKGKKDITDTVKEDTYEVPTIDTSHREGNAKKAKINKRTSSLVQILSF